MKTVLDILNATESYLAGRGYASPRSDAQWMLSHVLGMKRLDLYVQFERPLTDAELARMREALRRRSKGEPIQYIVGSTAFYSVELEVGPGVLIPRPETERLVDLAKAGYPGEGGILDVCTGSGAIALSLAKELPACPKVIGVDVSAEALVWAERNRKALALEQVTFLEGDLFGPVAGERFAVITANPPYVSEAEYTALPSDVRDHEPGLALLSGPEGLDLIRQIAAEGLGLLAPGGTLLMEIGETQGKAVKALFEAAGFADVVIKQDYTGRDRVLVANRQE